MKHCEMTGCEKAAAFYPTLCFPPPPPHQGEPQRVILNLHLCAGHAEAAEVKSVLSDAGWIRIKRAIRGQGFIEPRRKDAYVQMEALNGNGQTPLEAAFPPR